MPFSTDTDKLGVEYGISLLDTLDWIEEQTKNKRYTDEMAIDHRKRVCEELRSVLRLMKPYNAYLRKKAPWGGHKRW